MSNNKAAVGMAGAVAVVVIALALLVGLVSGPQAATAANGLPRIYAPTPVAAVERGVGREAALWSAKVLTATANTGAINVLAANVVDLEYVIDQGTVNTTTLKLQFSNDNVNWVDGVAVASNIAADGSDLQQYQVFGKWMRINAALTNSNATTVTVLAVLK